MKLVGTEESKIYKSFSLLLDDRNEWEKMAQASNPYGDGRASERIADALEKGRCEEFFIKDKTEFSLSLKKVLEDGNE